MPKDEKTTKQVENQQIFIVTLTEKFSVADYWYMLYKFTSHGEIRQKWWNLIGQSMTCGLDLKTWKNILIFLIVLKTG